MSGSSQEPDRRPFWKRKRYYLLGFAALLALAVFLVRGPLRDTTVDYLAKFAQNNIRGELDWESSAWQGLAGLRLSELSLRLPSGDELLSADAATFRVNPVARNLSVELREPLVRLSRDRSGKFNFSELLREGDGGGGRWSFSLELSGGTLEYTDAYPVHKTLGRNQGFQLALSERVGQLLGLPDEPPAPEEVFEQTVSGLEGKLTVSPGANWHTELSWASPGTATLEAQGGEGVRVELNAPTLPLEPLERWMSPVVPALRGIELEGDLEDSRLVVDTGEQRALRELSTGLNISELAAPDPPPVRGLRGDLSYSADGRRWVLDGGELGFAGGNLDLQRARLGPDGYLLQAKGSAIDTGWLNQYFSSPEHLQPGGGVDGTLDNLIIELKKAGDGPLQTHFAAESRDFRWGDHLSGRLLAEVSGEGDQFTLNQMLLDGDRWKLTVTGEAGPESYQLQYGAERIPLAGLAALVGPVPESEGSVQTGGVIQGSWGGSPEVEVQFQTESATVAGVGLRRTAGAAKYTGKKLSITGLTGRVSWDQIPESQFNARGELDLSAEGTPVQAEVLLGGMQKGPARLDRALIVLDGPLRSPDAELTASATVGGSPVQMTAQGNLSSEQSTVDYGLQGPGISAAGQIRAQPGTARPVTLRAQIARVDPSAFGPYPAGELSGSLGLDFTAAGEPLGDISVGSGSLTVPAAGGETLSVSDISAQAGLAGGRLTVQRASVSVEDSPVELDGTVDSDSLALLASSENLTLQPFKKFLGPAIPLSASGLANVVISGTPARPVLDFNFNSKTAVLGSAGLERFTLSATVSPQEGTEFLPLEDSSSVSTAGRDSAGSNGEIFGALPGALGSAPPGLQSGFSTAPGGSGSSGGDSGLPAFTVRINRVELRDDRGNLSGSGRFSSEPPYPAQAQLSARGLGLKTVVGLTGLGADAPVRGGIFGRADLSGNLSEPRFELDLRTEKGAIGETEVSDFAVQAARRDHVITVDRMRFATAESLVTGTGSFDLDNPTESRAQLEVPYFDLTLVNPLLTDFPLLSGVTGGHLSISADAQGRPVIEAEISSSQFHVGEYAFHSLSGHVQSSGETTEITNFSVSPEAVEGERLGRLFAEGTVPARIDELLTGGQAVFDRDGTDLVVRTESFPLSQLSTFAGLTETEVRGSTRGRLDLTGTIGAPEIRGDAQLKLTRLAAPGGLSVSDYYLTTSVSSAQRSGMPSSFQLSGYKLLDAGQVAAAEELPEASPEGSVEVFRGEGQFRASPPELIQLDSALLLDDLPRLELGELYRGPVGGKVSVEFLRRQRRFRVGGWLDLGPGGTMDLSSFRAGTGAPAGGGLPVSFDNLSINLLEPVVALYSPASMNAAISSPSPLTLNGTMENPVLRGSLEAADTSLVVFGRRIRFRQGARLTFSDAGGVIPFIEGTAVLVVPGAVESRLAEVPTVTTMPELVNTQPGDLTVYLHFNNLLTNLQDVGLSSNPPLPPEEIRAALVGQYIGSGTGATQSISENVGQGLVGFGGSRVARFIEEQLKLQSLNFRFRDDRSVFFNVEKAINPRLTLLFKRTFGAEFNQTETIGLRYDIIERFGFDMGVQFEFDRSTADQESKILFFLRKQF